MVETLLWSYIFICATLILFNVGFMLAMAVRAYVQRRRVKRMRKRIIHQMIRIFRGQEVEGEYLTFLSVALMLPNVLADYDKALEEIRSEIENGEFYLVDFDERTRVWIHLHDTVEKPGKREEADSKVRMVLRPKRSVMKPVEKGIAWSCFERHIEYTANVITSLTNAYRKKDEILQTYYAAFLHKYGYMQYSKPTTLIANLKDLLEDGGVFASENALQAVYTAKDENLVLDMLRILDKKEEFVHPKIISDGLLAFRGDAHALQRLLLQHRKDFSVKMQVNILTYLRFVSGAYCEEVFEILSSETEHDEVRFSCMRYFGKYRYDKAFRLLADFAKNEKGERIEYSIVALMTLRNYPSKKTMEILHSKLNSPYWFVRYNAAESLEVLGARYEELVDVFDGDDRFAREMLQYQFDQRYAENKERGL